ncbi:hypothetical protein [Maribacter sp. ACAM166]|uniref:hypothetical protein n=1 Tax=Maribacter sp. ACAM166 TaxID=2508996 RepID=UPI0010FEC0B4|nr:hypothetical protein [Maribacter sp. ACAM166]TLP71711.1 hypothetical protein ES765_19625 [Maribacter sp. ACAM166]
MITEQKVKIKKIVSIVPARMCLFGDHQDYLEQPVITCSIDGHITLSAKSNGTGFFHINKIDLNVKRDISIDWQSSSVEKGDHFLLALKVLRNYNCIPTEGYDILISVNIPIAS